MVCKIKKKIEEFKSSNGNNNFSVKELLMYQIQKGDNFEIYVKDKLETGAGKIGENRGRIKGITLIISVGLPLVIGGLMYVLRRLIRLGG